MTHGLLSACWSTHGRIVGYITLPTTLGSVRAGDPIHMFDAHPVDGELATFYRFLIFDDHLSEHGIAAGDTILVDASTIGYWDESDHDGEVVLVRTHFGPLVGRFFHGIKSDGLILLDGSGDMIIRTPEMIIMGVARHLHRPVRPDSRGDYFV